ncbi:hypothetical protein MJH12_16700, partial [bacterium]|nr:hypothetical protein [bacterium]
MSLSNLKIRSKIWISVLIILFSYVTTLFMNHYLDKKIADRLETTITSVLPSSQLLIENVSLFKSQVKSYEDGVLSGEEEDIEIAMAIKERILANIKNTMFLDANNIAFNDKLKKQRELLESYSNSADRVYKLLAAEEGDESTQKEAKVLSQDKETLTKGFAVLSSGQEAVLISNLKIC